MAQHKFTIAPNNQLGLKPFSKALILAETMDLISTFWGIIFLPQMWEANPLYLLLGGWFPVIAVKIIAVALIIITLERVRNWPSLVWLIPTAAAMPVVWNFISIIAELMI